MGVVNRRLRAPLRRVGARVRALPQEIGVGCVSSARSAPLILSLAVVWLGIPSLRQRAAEQVSREEKAIEVP